MAKIIFNNVQKKFGEDVVIPDLNLEIEEGSFTVLVGPSGCGKSTTLRMIAGLEKQSGGEIWIGDKCVNDVAPGKRDIAMVFQNYALYPTMSVRENIEFGLKNRKVSKDERKKLIEEITEIVDLTKYLDRKPSDLSGGQRQRVALARAMVKKPKVFLMDEPLSNLDAKLRAQMRTELIELHKRLGSTFVYVTHDQVEAMSMGDQIVLMNQGEIQQTDQPMELYQNPKNTFTAQFIGTPPMNVLDCNSYKGLIPMKNKNVSFVGFRPEKALINVEEISGIKMSGKINTRETLGSETIYQIQSENNKVLVKSFGSPIDIGTKVSITIPNNDLYFFDETGHRMDREKMSIQEGAI